MVAAIVAPKDATAAVRPYVNMRCDIRSPNQLLSPTRPFREKLAATDIGRKASDRAHRNRPYQNGLRPTRVRHGRLSVIARRRKFIPPARSNRGCCPGA